MDRETFPHHDQVYQYAEERGLAFAWEGTPEFEKRLRYLMRPDQYQLMAVHTRRGMRRVLLFPKAIAARVPP